MGPPYPDAGLLCSFLKVRGCLDWLGRNIKRRNSIDYISSCYVRYQTNSVFLSIGILLRLTHKWLLSKVKIFPHEPRSVEQRGDVPLTGSGCSLDLGAEKRRKVGNLIQKPKLY